MHQHTVPTPWNVAQQFRDRSLPTRTFRHYGCTLQTCPYVDTYGAWRRDRQCTSPRIRVHDGFWWIQVHANASKLGDSRLLRGSKWLRQKNHGRERDNQEQRWLLAAFALMCRPAFSSADQTGWKRTITHSSGTICFQRAQFSSPQGYPCAYPSVTLRPFSLTLTLA